MIKQFIFLTKPGIIFGNFVSVMGGFFLAAQGEINLGLLLVALLGTSLVVASGCVINNIIDQDIDVKMERTRNRALVKKTVSNQAAFIFAAVLGIAGFGLLYFYSNLIAFGFAVLGYFDYVVLYSLIFKRRSVHQTLVGSISGAAPPVIGYCVASGQFDAGALFIFITFCIWQLPHSFGIAIYRLDDYISARIPVLPTKKGIKATKIQSLIYVLLFTISGSMLYILNYVGLIYLVIFIALCAYWVYLAIDGFKAVDDRLWARRFFLFSVIIITVFSLLISVDYQLNPDHLFIFKL
ncbi:heme o synthase [Alkanindiges sp. WGS2144]|uniref:heme o synthase n=1 Tax=Alkanindiges sp. WGS2144 TaxID=3366808 RepID=UPI003752F867